MAKRKTRTRGHDYFGIGRTASIILAIIPVTALFLGVFTRIRDGKIVAALLRFFLGWNIVWIADLVLMILQGRILRIINI